MSTDDAPTQRVSRPLLIVLGVLLVAALVYFLLVLPGQNGVTDADQTQVVVGSEPPVAGTEVPVLPEDEVTEAPSEVGPVEPTFEVFDARDPFDQLVSAQSSAATVGETQDTTATTGTTGTTDTGTAIPGDVPGAVGAPVTGDPAQTTVGTTTIRLEEVFRDGGTDKVLVEVNGEGYEAAEGDTVAGEVAVLDIEGNCATMRFDDRRFILCEGEQIRK